MKIEIEIGTEEQKELIRKEFLILTKLQEEIPSLALLRAIIIPRDFNLKINELENTSNYYSDRDTVQTMAKTILNNGDFYIIINPILYNVNNDLHTRYLTIFHEMNHVMLNIDYVGNLDSGKAIKTYRNILGRLFAEYVAERFAIDMLIRFFELPSFTFKHYILGRFNNFSVCLTEKDTFYTPISLEISRFRRFNDINIFMTNLRNPFEGCTMSIMYSFAFIDACKHFKNKENYLINNSPFINKNTLNLVDYFRSKYISKDYELTADKGLKLTRDFVTNFGFKYEDTIDGLSIHVLDI